MAPNPESQSAIPKPETAPADRHEDQDTLSQGEQDQVKDFEKFIADKAKAEKDKLDDLEKSKVLPTDTLSERAGKSMHVLFDKQRAEIDKLAKSAKEDLLKEKHDTHEHLEDLIAAMEGKVETRKDESIADEIETRGTVFVETILRLMKDKTGTMTNDDVEAAEKALMGAEKCIINADLEKLIKKITKGDSLTEPELGTIIDNIDVSTINVQRASFEHGFETTSAGALLALMKPEEKFHLVEVFMDSAKKGQTVQLLEAFMGTGVLSMDQVQRREGVPIAGSKPTLFEIAISKHVPTEYGPLTDAIYEQYYKPKFDSGTYSKTYDDFMKFMRTDEGRRLGGSFSRNAFWDIAQTPSGGFMGSPLSGMLLAVWGGTVMTLNGMANHEDLASLSTNPSFLIAASATIFGAGAIDAGGRADANALDMWRRFREYLLNPKSVAERIDDQNKLRMADLYKRSPVPQMRNYLDQNGYEASFKVRKAKVDQGKKYPETNFTLDELIAFEKTSEGNSARLHTLEEISRLSPDGKKRAVEDLNQFTQTASNLDYKDENKRVPGIAILVKDIRETGIPTQGSAGNPTSGPKESQKTAQAKAPEAPKPKTT